MSFITKISMRSNDTNIYSGEPTFGPITFRTWDFGGQREYYATHQYFLSRRSLYIVVWRTTDGDAALPDMHQWLVNIQVT